MKIKTAGYGGRKETKYVTVQTNDPVTSYVQLKITGEVEPLVSITPKVARLQGYPSTEVVARVRIVPNPKYPFTITDTTVSANPKFFHRLEKEEGKEGWTLFLRNMQQSPGMYSGTVNLITDSKYQKTIPIHVFGRILSPPPGPAAGS
ncbi:MAG: hypothetical protein JRI97_07620 [Deltaproteobacteria bacterium]|nr:hypothetical protein [Deltaproteobacteria bacterium]